MKVISCVLNADSGRQADTLISHTPDCGSTSLIPRDILCNETLSANINVGLPTRVNYNLQ